jgi:hypothetical protein
VLAALGQPTATSSTQEQQKQQQPLPHQQQRQLSMARNSSSPVAFPGLLQLQLKDNSICSTNGIIIVNNLAPGVALSAHQQQPSSSSSSSSSSKLHSPSVTAPGLLLDISSSGGAAAAEAAVDLGDVCGSAFLACARIKLCWMSPYHSSSIAGLPRHIQFMLVQLQDTAAADGGDAVGGDGDGGSRKEAMQQPMYATILPLLPEGCKATLQPAK